MDLSWTRVVPTVEGVYLGADEYGRFHLFGVRGGPNDMPPLLRTTAGMMDVFGYWFAAFNPRATFPPEMELSIQKAWDDLPRKKLQAAEDDVARHPRSPKAKERLREVKREIAAAKRASSASR